MLGDTLVQVLLEVPLLHAAEVAVVEAALEVQLLLLLTPILKTLVSMIPLILKIPLRPLRLSLDLELPRSHLLVKQHLPRDHDLQYHLRQVKRGRSRHQQLNHRLGPHSNLPTMAPQDAIAVYPPCKILSNLGRRGAGYTGAAVKRNLNDVAYSFM